MTSTLNIALLGATGRMGREIASVIQADDSLELVGASTHRQHADFGHPLYTDGPQLSNTLEALKDAEAVIDFSTAAAVQEHAHLCVQRSIPLVCGVTALSRSATQHLQRASESIAVLYAPNMSVGVTLCFVHAEQLAKQLGPDVEVAIHDIHHAAKLDAPSGTALEFGRLIKAAIGKDISINYSDVREGLHPGEHHVRFTKGEEVIELRHKAGSRTEFASGAVRAAQWLAKQPPGFYNMRNLLNITSS